MRRAYWAIFVDEFLPEILPFPADKRDELIDAIAGHAEMENEATGHDVFSANRAADLRREHDDLVSRASRAEDDRDRFARDASEYKERAARNDSTIWRLEETIERLRGDR